MRTERARRCPVSARGSLAPPWAHRPPCGRRRRRHPASPPPRARWPGPRCQPRRRSSSRARCRSGRRSPHAAAARPLRPARESRARSSRGRRGRGNDLETLARRCTGGCCRTRMVQSVLVGRDAFGSVGTSTIDSCAATVQYPYGSRPYGLRSDRYKACRDPERDVPGSAFQAGSTAARPRNWRSLATVRRRLTIGCMAAAGAGHPGNHGLGEVHGWVEGPVHDEAGGLRSVFRSEDNVSVTPEPPATSRKRSRGVGPPASWTAANV